MNSKEQPQAGSDPVADHLLKMQQTQVFVVGDIILDSYIAGKVSRLSPEAPVPVVLENSRRSVLGGAANVAANVAAFGAKAFLAGRIGADTDGEEVTALSKHLGIDTKNLVKSSAVPTTRKLRILAGYQQIVRVDHEALDELAPHHCSEIAEGFAVFSRLSGAKALVISDYGKGVCTPDLLRKLIAMATASNIAVVTDPKSLDLNRYSGSTLIKPNLGEGREVLRMRSPGLNLHNLGDFRSEARAVMEAVAAAADARNVVLSLSEHGVMACGKDFPDILHLKASALQVADVSGAGDTMIAFLALGLGCGLGFRRTVHVANVAAGLVCAKLGTATISSSELLGSFSRTDSESTPEKIVTRSEAARVAADLRSAGKKIVFTNGCFDLLHAGHVTLLQEARGFGDVLIVGINSDASVRALKGPSRPIQNEQDRAHILAAMACVDFVEIFGELDPLESILATRPHVLVKGGDWTPETIVGAKETIGWGGMVKTIDLVPGRSTTALVEKSKTKIT